MTAAAGRVLVEDRGPVRVLQLSHPSRRNAVDGAMLAALCRELERAGQDGVRCLLLRGEGERAFCAGSDLSSLPEAGATGPLPDAGLEAAIAALEQAGPPVIALVNGPAIGAGCELASACDLRVGSPASAFGMPPARLGIVYAPAGIQRLARLVGPSRAREMFFTARTVDAATALAWGLLDRLLEPGEAEAEALRLCEAIAVNAPLAVQGMRRVFSGLAAVQLPEAELEAIERLRRDAFRSEDAREGRRAFLEKRPPRFAGR